jgi:hypothetical protein
MQPFRSPQSAYPENAYDWYARHGNGPCSVLVHHGPEIQRWAYQWGVVGGRYIIRYCLEVDAFGRCTQPGTEVPPC